MRGWKIFCLSWGIGLVVVIIISFLMGCAPVQQDTTPRPTQQVSAEDYGPDFSSDMDCGEVETAFLSDESIETLPCVVVRNDGYFYVTSWEPTKMLKLNHCKNSDGGIKPCVWDSKTMGDHNGKIRFLVYLEN